MYFLIPGGTFSLQRQALLKLQLHPAGPQPGTMAGLILAERTLHYLYAHDVSLATLEPGQPVLLKKHARARSWQRRQAIVVKQEAIAKLCGNVTPIAGGTFSRSVQDAFDICRPAAFPT